MARKRVVQMRNGLGRLREGVEGLLAPPASTAWVHAPVEEPESDDAGAQPSVESPAPPSAPPVPEPEEPEPETQAEPEPDPALLKWLPDELEPDRSEDHDEGDPSRWLIDESSRG